MTAGKDRDDSGERSRSQRGKIEMTGWADSRFAQGSITNDFITTPNAGYDAPLLRLHLHNGICPCVRLRSAHPGL